MKRAVIFSGGAFEKPDWVALPKDAMILCADSGLRHARALGISPDWVLGDFDSSSEQPEGRIGIACGRGATEVAPYGEFGVPCGCSIRSSRLAVPCSNAVQHLRETFGVVLPGHDHGRQATSVARGAHRFCQGRLPLVGAFAHHDLRGRSLALHRGHLHRLARGQKAGE